MLRACAAPKISMSGMSSPDVTELSTNSAQATIRIAVFTNRPNLRKTGGAMDITSRRRDFECSILSMTICASRIESVMMGITPLSIPRITTVRGSRVVEGESQEHSLRVVRQLFVSLTHLTGKATYQGVNINRGDFQAEYEKEKAEENSGLLSYGGVGIN